MCVWLLADLEVSFQQSLDVFIGSILSQPCLEILQLVQKSIQTLAKLKTQKHKHKLSNFFSSCIQYSIHWWPWGIRYLAGLDWHPWLLFHLVNLLPDLWQLRPNFLQVMQLLQRNLHRQEVKELIVDIWLYVELFKCTLQVPAPALHCRWAAQYRWAPELPWHERTSLFHPSDGQSCPHRLWETEGPPLDAGYPVKADEQHYKYLFQYFRNN